MLVLSNLTIIYAKHMLENIVTSQYHFPKSISIAKYGIRRTKTFYVKTTFIIPIQAYINVRGFHNVNIYTNLLFKKNFYRRKTINYS